MMMKIVPIIAVLGAVTLTACDSLGQAMTAHTDLVARAAGHELTVDRAASLIAENPRLPAQPEVVDALANLWVDYILLATAMVQDSTLKNVNLQSLIRPVVEQEIVYKLRDDVIQVDTAITDDELRAQYERDQPNLQVRARHILLRVPPDATPAQRDSVLNRTRDVQQRAAGGADFAVLARDYSEDPGSAGEGGDLGFFSQGQMVQPFEEAAFALAPGQVSDVVETPFGFHVIKVEERQLAPFEDVKAEYRQFVLQNRQVEAEEAYIEQLTGPLNIQVQDDAPEISRELARKPMIRLSGRAASRPLVTYRGGTFTAADFVDLVRRLQPNARAQYASAQDEQLVAVLRSLAKNDILIAEARRRKLDLTPAEQDSLAQEARRHLAAAAGAAGLHTIEPQQGETMAQAVDRKVMGIMRAIVRGDQNPIPLGPVAYPLRERGNVEIFERSYQPVLARVEESRPAVPVMPVMPDMDGQGMMPPIQPMPAH
jgi:hypothetical protein